ncbi:helix-turn-helix transcriptional regulator [Planosporangium thailandense]|uniref:Helix-turn-helix transcriptional regulator n=1 Tax=Planosporangium thailandense TaxID=765197 RepID=A0ABX0YA16_9ACTN|nr:helix-turn-helix transcriptional regulator [Planosporangium thailandense]
MEIDEWAIGQRIAVHRARRGLTQQELAGLVGISLSMMKKIESGDRPVTRFAQLVLFAQALRIKDLRDLTGVPLRLTSDGHRGHPAADALYRALMDRGVPDGYRPDLDALARRIERTWQAWQAASVFRYELVGQQLPNLIQEVQAATRVTQGGDRRRALRLASTTYQLVRTWTKRVGEYELSLVAADRAVCCALDADDPDMAAAGAWNLAMILSAQGRIGQAREVIQRAIRELMPRMAQASPRRLAVFGGLHLLGATEAARDDRPDEAHRQLKVATDIATRTGETNYFRMAFGPINVALYRLSATIEFGQVRQALELAEQIPIGQSPAVERRLTFYLDSARCYARSRHDVAAVHMLQRLHQESPEELRYSVHVRETLRELRSRMKPAVEPDLHPLLNAASLPD